MLYPVYSRMGRGNLVLEHSVTHAPPATCFETLCGGIFILLLKRGNENNLFPLMGNGYTIVACIATSCTTAP